jgi:Tht1-like nuclear fusion protein
LSSNDVVPTPVRELLEAWDNKPACHKAATRLLIVSCKSTKEDVTNPRPSIENLENTKSIFAARLAICELRDAGVSTPSQCIPITTVSGDLPGKISGGDLRACLKALESKPQSWTSYSNNRQGSVAICAFSRADMMKDEELERLRLLTTVGYGVSQALADALLRATSQQEAEIAFAQALKTLHAEQLRDLAKAYQESKAHLKESSTQLNKAVSHVSDTIHLAGIAAADLKQLVEAIFLSAATGGAELASIRFRDAEANHEAALALQELVQNVTNNDFAILRDGLSEVATTVHNISTTVGKTAQNADLLQDATAAAIENVRIVEAVADRSQHKAVQLLESLNLLATPIEGLSKFFQTLKVIGSKGAVFAEMALGAWLVAELFGRRHAQYLLLLHGNGPA